VGSPFIQWGIGGLAMIVAAIIVWGISRMPDGRKRALGAGMAIAIVAAAQWYGASRGVFREWDRIPPPFMLMMLALAIIVVHTARSPLGQALAEHTSFAALIGFHTFRLPLEIVMHRAAQEGVMPVQMSFAGYNFDILTGASALLLALYLQVRPAFLTLIRAWNWLGFLLLLNIVSIAVASTPLFAAFGPDRLNTWVAFTPYVWLPGILVMAALFGHLLVWRKLAWVSRAR
jgi:hypothetical protein